MKVSYNEFHISRAVRDACKFDQSLYASSGNVIFANFQAVQSFQLKLNALFDERDEEEKKISAGSLNAMGLIDEIFHFMCMLFRKNKAPLSFTNLLADLDDSFGKGEMDTLLIQFMNEFPPTAVYQKKLTNEDYLFQTCFDPATGKQRDNREQVLEEMILLHLANENPAFHPFQILFDDQKLSLNANYIKTWNQIKAYFKTQPVFGDMNNDLITMLKEPVVASPTSLKGQLDYIRLHWGTMLGEWLKRMLEGIDTISEEEKAAWHPMNGGSPDMAPYSYENLMKEYERFSPDRDWMPKVVLMAKTVLVWLYQLSKKYDRQITRLDQIPDEELDALRDEGFTGLWLIGLWERSSASQRIKQICGNPEAAASAYSLFDYDIAANLGGWDALDNLRRRCWARGIRLASDMVPNHTGMDGKWVIEHPDYFITRKDCPFPQYTFNGENLSHDNRVSLYLEDHYYSKSDCAVCFKRVDNQTGDVTYIYHGNDGTGMPWNDTAQIDFLNPTAREAVMQKILHVAQNFPIIRFDAAMVLAKKHIRRLWYPEPGHGGDIATRSQYALTTEQFEKRIPNEFWREVVDRCAKEMPDTLLLAEAFWMMEGYFTRTLGMHRVYNSAFMNMLKKEENQKYRDTVKNTIKFDPQVLKRFVNFMNNPDEETAVAQFGKGDKYFGVCTLMITMPGLPMFGHGQLEGFEEKYGMEYTKAYRDEKPDEQLMNRHWHDIFPLLKKRYLFAQIENFLFYDVWNNNVVNENVYAYSNGVGSERAIVFYNNKYDSAAGWIKQSCEYAVKTGSGEKDVAMYTKSIAEGLELTPGKDHFCIFREHTAGLWYVRRSDDIIANGMFVSLKGFEYQVYLDVQQVVDGVDGKYENLCQLLNGRGVPDLDVAWQEHKYKDLYAALAQFATPEFFKQIHILFTPIPLLKAQKISLPTTEDIFNSVHDSAIKYYEMETKFAAQAAEEAANLSNSTAKKHDRMKTAPTQKEARLSEKSLNATPEQRFALFCKQLEYLSTTAASAQGATKTMIEATSFQYRTSRPAFKVTFDNLLYEGLIANESSPEILTAFATVSSAGSKNCLTWGYDRKLTELLEASGLRTPDMKTTFKKLFIMMHVRDFNFGTTGQMKSTYETARLLVDGENSFLLTGANDFNGIRWFNKEKMDSTLWYGFAAVVMYSPRILREQVYRLYRTLVAAKDRSEYQCVKFTEAVKPAKPSRIASLSGKKNEKKSAGHEVGVKAKKTPAHKAGAEVKAEKSVEKKTAAVKKSAAGSKNSKQK
jgi:glycosidase